MALRSGRCWYCGQERGDLSEEHIIPERFGGTLVTRSVCESCNRMAGKLEWLLGEWPDVHERRGLHGLPDRRGKRQQPLTRIYFDGGAEGLVARTTSGSQVIKVFPRAVDLLADGSVVYEVPAPLADEFRARKRNRGESCEIRVRELADYGRGYTKYGLGTASVGLWARFAAKVALGCVSLLEDRRDWLDSRGATRLQALLHRDHVTFEVGVTPSELHPSEDIAKLLVPPEHLLYFADDSREVRLNMVLFGDLFFGTLVPEFDMPSRQPAWLLTPGGGPPTEQATEDLERFLVERRRSRDR